jgi:hypothetical protein
MSGTPAPHIGIHAGLKLRGFRQQLPTAHSVVGLAGIRDLAHGHHAALPTLTSGARQLGP